MNAKREYFLKCFIIFLISIIALQNLFAQTDISNIEILTESSDMIVVGKVESLHSLWNNKKDRIFTKVNIEVNEYLKNENQNKILEILVPGGEIGKVGEIYSDMPKFNKDEKVLLFIKNDKQDNLIVNRGVEGKYNILNGQIKSASAGISSRRLESLKNRIIQIVKIKN